MGPLIFTKNLGFGLRIWLNPIKKPGVFLLLGMPFMLWAVLMTLLELLWQSMVMFYHVAKLLFVLVKLSVSFIKMLLSVKIKSTPATDTH